MLNKKTIISLFSVLVFIFPLIYQPLHVVLYHSEHHEYNEGISANEEKCLAYEYHFASFDLPEVTHLNLEKQRHNSILNTFYNSSKLGFETSKSSSRAPPTYS